MRQTKVSAVFRPRLCGHVIEAIEAGSLRRQAAERFGVGKTSAIRWHACFRDAGEIVPKPAGGDRSPPAIEAYAVTILEVCRAHPLIFLWELRDRLGEQGVRTYTSGLWRFFGHHSITRKMRLFTQMSSSART